MARTFVILVNDPYAVFDRLRQWAATEGFALNGGPTGGTFSGKPKGLAATFFPRISGSYSFQGPEVVIRTDQDVPLGVVTDRLSKVGLRVIRYA